MTLTDPNSFGIGQAALVVIAFVAICVLVQSARHWKMLDCLAALVIAAIAFALLYATLAISAYAGPNILVAKVVALPVANAQNELSVDLTLYSANGQVESTSAYLVNGNEWMLQGDIVKVSGLLAMIGLHSGYKLTRLEGRFDDRDLEASARHTVVVLNGGDDGFFQAAYHLNSFLSPFIDASYGNAVFNGAGTFNIYVSQTGLWAKGG